MNDWEDVYKLWIFQNESPFDVEMSVVCCEIQIR